MAEVELRGVVLDDTGTAINGATVELFDADTTSPVRSSTSTDSSGFWTFSHATRGRFDVRITNGNDVVWLRARDRYQVDMMQANSTDNVPVVGTRSEDAASVQVMILEGDRATPADGDEAYISLRMSDSAGNQDEQARIAWEATTVLDGATQDGDLIFLALVNGSLTELFRLDGSSQNVNVVGSAAFSGSNDTIDTAGNTIRRDSSGNFQLDALGGVIVNLDTNNNGTTSVLGVRANAVATDVWSVAETGIMQCAVLTDGTRGAAGTAGRVFFNSGDGQLNIDNGTNWTLPDGTIT